MLSWNNPRAPLAPSTAPFPQAPQLDGKSHLRAGNKTKPGAKPTASPNDYFSARSNPILLTPWQIQTGAGKPQSQQRSADGMSDDLNYCISFKPLENPTTGVKTWHSAQNLMGYR